LAQILPTRTIPEVYTFAPPVSPHLAARLANVRIELRKIRLPELIRSDERKGLIVEGAGGALVPVNHSQFMTDLMRHLKFPVLLVSRTALGTINHTLLSIAGLRAAQLELRGVIMVGKPNIENRKAIEHYGDVEVLGTLPILKKINRTILLKVFCQNFSRNSFAT
jgi:dethiobiotin synthetase